MKLRFSFLLLPLLLLALSGPIAFAQDYSNKGKDFWIIYTGHIDNTTSRMALYITAPTNATGVLSVGGSTLPFTVTANQVTTLRLTNATTPSNSLAYNSQSAGTGVNRGIHIVSDTPVVVYSHILNAARSGATLVLPTNVLGREYYVSGYASVGNNANSKSEFAIVATQDNTTVEIKPSAADAGNTHLPNVSFQVVLNTGDVYQYQSANNGDLTGSYIKSVASANSPCKPIAVFAGSTWTAMGCASASSGDNLYQQMFPLVSWGKTYITAPFSLRSYDIFRIMVKDVTTVVQVNGVTLPPATLINNAYYEINTSGNNTPRIITADKAICVVQYMITQNCDNVNSDPEMVILNPIEQTLNDIVVLSARNDLTPPNTNITRHFINIIIKTAGLSSLRIDGALPTATPVTIPATGYSYLQEEVTTSTAVNPTHRVYADSGFVAIAYGYGNVESYGYNAGTNVRDLYQFISIQNPYATVPFPAACKNSPFYFSIVFPYEPTQIIWNFGGLFANVTINNPVYDSTWTVNGKQLYRYKISTPYTINSTGTFPIQVQAQNPTPDGCSGLQTINYDLQVFNPPTADFITNAVCFPNATQFTDNSNTGGRQVINRYWDFGDAATSTVNNPSHTYATAGTYQARYALITDVGCLSDTIIHPVTLYPLPTATASGNATVCKDQPSPLISFTGVIGTAPFTFSYTINGGPVQTVTSNNGNTATVPAPTTTAGTFIYTLVSVQDGSPATCSQVQSGTVIVTVNPLPAANISGTAAICLNAPSPVVTFTGAGSTAPYTFTYTINGGAPQTVSTVAGNSVTVPVSTSNAGVFTYSLVSVQDGSSTQCMQTQTGSAVITVNPLPSANIGGNNSVCKNTSPPLVTFTGSGAVAPYIFTYSINGGPAQTVTSTGNTATVAVPTNIAGTFIYSLISVRDASTTLCSQLQSGTVTVVVYPLPAPAFSASPLHCELGIVNFTDGTVANASGLTNWYWNFGDPVSGAANTSIIRNPSHVFTTAGDYTIKLVATNTNGCVSDTLYQLLHINPLPFAGYIIPDVCLSDTYAQFNDTSRVNTPDNITVWNWNFGDPVSGGANTSVLQNPQHSYTAVGNYSVQLIVVSNNGCRDTITQNLSVNGSFPVADFNVLSPSALCANDSVALAEASFVFPGNITRIEIYWDNIGVPAAFDLDDYPVTGRIYKHRYPDFQSPLTKTFTIRYRAYSGGVCLDDTLKTITVHASPRVQFAAMPPICLDAAPRQITQASEIGGVPGSAVYSGPGVSPTGLFNPAAAGPGTHTIKYIYTSSAGGCKDSITQTITVYAPPQADFSISSPVCETKDITFSQSSSTSVGSLTNWVWDFGDGSPLVNATNGNPVTHRYTTWGNYNVKHNVVTSNGCISIQKVIPVFVNPQPVPDFNIPVSLCLPNANATFLNQSTIADGTTSAVSYYWDFGDPASGTVNNSTAKNPSHTYVNAVPYNVNLVVTSLAGCVEDTTIVLNTIHKEPIASFNVNPNEVCIGDPFRFTDNTNQQGGTGTQWNWNMGDGNNRTGASINYTYATAGTYTVNLFTLNNFGCRSTTYSTSITVHPYPVVDAGPGRLVLEGGQITLQPVVSGNDLSFNWTPVLYFISSNTILNPTIRGVDDIRYLLTVTARGGCADTSSVFIKVLKTPAVPNVFSPNGDGIHDKWEIQYLDTYLGCTIDLYNRYGQLIYHSNGYPSPWDGTIIGKPVPVGTYYYIINPKNGRKPLTGYVDILR
jgi:gliding motility-associated-like protein